MRTRWLLPILLACGGGSFAPQSKIDNVRILAARADKPYAKPGDVVNVEVLADDGRETKPEAMQTYWLPFVCKNPEADLYYSCFATLAGGRDGGAGDAGVPPFLVPGVDITPFLIAGPKFSFTMPKDVIDTHPVIQGTERYGIVFTFVIACPGRVKLLPIDLESQNPQQVPIGCFDTAGNQLGPSQFVIAFSRVYAYETLTNQNPEITRVVMNGQAVDPAVGVTFDRCVPVGNAGCPGIPITVDVPESSWEIAQGQTPEGQPLHEQIWASYAFTRGDFERDGVLLYDTTAGADPHTENSFYPPNEASQGKIFIVVHDNRAGASWVSFPVTVK